ncbi:hypothetical protein IIA15_10255 [candidate division TA06 bacterium]|nr:hypothetical protein [candidate division TA06 bacterium]
MGDNMGGKIIVLLICIIVIIIAVWTLQNHLANEKAISFEEGKKLGNLFTFTEFANQSSKICNSIIRCQSRGGSFVFHPETLSAACYLI